MHHAIAHKLGVLQAGNHGEHALLLAPFEPRLKAHQVIQGSLGVFLAQLYHRIGFPARAGINKPNGLQRAKGQCLTSAGGQNFHGQTALKHQLLFEIM